jgi:hypothetical protein
MLVIEELNKLVRRILVDFLSYVAKIKTCFRVSRPRASDGLAEYGSLAMGQQGQMQGDGPLRRAIPGLFDVPKRAETLQRPKRVRPSSH